MLPKFNDYYLDFLVGLYVRAAEELADLLEELAQIEGSRNLTLYNQILKILRELKSVSSSWAQEAITAAFKKSDERTISRLLNQVSDRELSRSFTQIHEGAVDALARGMMNDLEKAFGSVATLAQKLSRNARIDSHLSAEAKRQVALGIAQGQSGSDLARRVGKVLRKDFREGVVSIIGSNGRMYRFALDYYAALVAHQTQRQAMSLAVLLRAQENGFDLVRISPNPSTTGDYCNAYRGRVFSISGTDTRFPPLAATPNGGPPFHPWCKHSVHIFVPELYDQDAISEFGDVDAAFLLQPGEENHKRILKLWTKASQDNPDLGALSHV